MASRPPIPRWLAWLALLALLAAGGVCSYAVLTDRADFIGAARPEPAGPKP